MGAGYLSTSFPPMSMSLQSRGPGFLSCICCQMASWPWQATSFTSLSFCKQGGLDLIGGFQTIFSNEAPPPLSVLSKPQYM